MGGIIKLMRNNEKKYLIASLVLGLVFFVPMLWGAVDPLLDYSIWMTVILGIIATVVPIVALVLFVGGIVRFVQGHRSRPVVLGWITNMAVVVVFIAIILTPLYYNIGNRLSSIRRGTSLEFLFPIEEGYIWINFNSNIPREEIRQLVESKRLRIITQFNEYNKEVRVAIGVLRGTEEKWVEFFNDHPLVESAEILVLEPPNQ